MSRARKLCEEFNECVRKRGRAYLIYTNKNGLKISGDFTSYDAVVMNIFHETSEADVLDHILMIWEDECDNRFHHLVPNYLLAIRDLLWSDYNVD